MYFLREKAGKRKTKRRLIPSFIPNTLYNILYEDSDLLVIEKPAGVVVNRAQSVKEPTIQDWMEQTYDLSQVSVTTETEEFVSRSGVVHRLDKETSGALVLAKTNHAFHTLKAQFKERSVQKHYVALAHGKITPDEGAINVPVGRLPWNRTRFGVFPGGRDAYSDYKVGEYLQDSSGNQYSLVEVFPKTGRTHQIRVHLQYIGHPIVSDMLYAGRKRVRADREWCPRLFLHAHQISICLVSNGQEHTIVCPLPTELRTALQTLSTKHI